MKITFQIKELFFDREKIINALDRADRAALSKIGAFIRTRARSMIRKRKGTAAPGSAPNSHVGTLRQMIYFGFEPSTKTVVVGPVQYGAGEAPNLLEFGGDIRRIVHGRPVSQHYRGNPFMRPSLDAEVAAGTMPEHWANSVKA